MEDVSTEKSYEEIYLENFNRMVWYCHYMRVSDCTVELAEDIVQNAFLELYGKWNLLKSHDELLLIAWLRRTIRNMLFNIIRNKKNKPYMVNYEDCLFDKNLSYNETFECERGHSFAEYVAYIKDHISDEEYALFSLYVIENLSLVQIASMTKTNPSTVKTRWRRLSIKLRNMIQRFDKMP